MQTKDFCYNLYSFYGQDLLNKKNQIQIAFLKEWLDETVPEEDRKDLLRKTLSTFEPTGVNPVPLIPHISKLYTSIDSYRDVAIKLASAIVDKVFKYGYYGLGSYEKNAPKKDLEIVRAFSGSSTNFYHRFNDLDNEKINLAQLRDFIISKFKTENINKNKTLKQLLGDRAEVLKIENKKAIN